jgi:2-alkenal reductase
METTDKRPANPVSTHSWLTGCASVLLLTTAFVIGGLLGGLGGGGLVLWATGNRISLGQPSPEQPDVAPPLPDATPTPTPTSVPTSTSAVPTIAPTPSIADGVSQVLPAVVTIINHQAEAENFGEVTEARIRGSGIIIDHRGYIVTNYHVVEGANQLTVILDTGEELPATLIAVDQTRDMALVRVDNGDLPTARWGESAEVRPGEWAIAIGSALGDFPNSVTLGVISAVDRSLELDGGIKVEGLIQTDAAINKGNSGGPLINQKGEVIGINTFIIREGQRIGVAEGIGFAIPSDSARQLIEEWVAADSP